MSDTEDIVPGLLEQIQKDFTDQFRHNSKVINIWGKIKSKEATYKEANEFAVECGEMLSNAYIKYITVDTLPEGRMWYNIASRILEPTLRTNYSLITDVCDNVQTAINEKADISLKAVKPAVNQNRVKGLIDKVSNEEDYENVEWVLKEPIVNYSQSIVDDYIKENAEFHYKSGLTPKIERTASGGCCEWCANLVGTYDYPYVPSDVYRRHKRCRCVVEYVSDGKYRQNVHDKTWANGEMSPEAREREAMKQSQIQHKNQRKKTEEYYVDQLMKAHPEWSREGATIYYRTNGVAENVHSGLEPLRITEVRASIFEEMHRNGEISYHLSQQNYDNHVYGTKDYERKRIAREAKGYGPQSCLTISKEEAQKIINEMSGKGIAKMNKNGEIIKTEKITCDIVIGKYYDKGRWYETNKAQIHHSKGGSHIVPIKGNDYD